MDSWRFNNSSSIGSCSLVSFLIILRTIYMQFTQYHVACLSFLSSIIFHSMMIFNTLRASAHIRVSARFDYQPDIFKDYKETSYCGYGDSCKLMHDRGDYKSGWQLEQEWNEKEKTRTRKMAMGNKGGGDDESPETSDEEDHNALSFACFICRKPFVDVVVTKCKHYFCEHCALKHHAKNKKCFVCNEPTYGIFNTAFEIRKRKTAEGK